MPVGLRLFGQSLAAATLCLGAVAACAAEQDAVASEAEAEALPPPAEFEANPLREVSPQASSSLEPVGDGFDFGGGDAVPLERFGDASFERFDAMDEEPWSAELSTADRFAWVHGWLGTRHSATHGRAIGPGGPLRGTSWLNRPVEVATDFGALIMTGEPSDGVNASNDFFAALSLGYDWDHYWGGRLRVGWSTPTLDNRSIATDQANDNFWLVDASVAYYPWGDSRTRPYLRVGMGLTELEFTNSFSQRQHEVQYTLPLAIGIKHQLKRTVVWRAELANNIAFGSNGSNTTDFITLTFGFEGRFGGRPSGYWAWRPRGRGW